MPEHGLVVDLGGLSEVRVHGSSARVGAGARLIDVYEGIGGAGQALPAGSCGTVGIGNLTRLRKIARRYDPDRVLAFAQGT